MPKAQDQLSADQAQSEAAEPTPVADALDKTGGPQFVIDQMADTLERAKIEARGRTDDLSIHWGHEPEQAADADTENDPGDNVYARRFYVVQNGTEPQTGLTVDQAKAALDAIGAA